MHKKQKKSSFFILKNMASIFRNDHKEMSMCASSSIFNTVVETEEFITAEEFLRRRENGEINPADVRYVPDSGREDEPFGGFMVRLRTPRYRVDIPQPEPAWSIL